LVPIDKGHGLTPSSAETPNCSLASIRTVAHKDQFKDRRHWLKTIAARAKSVILRSHGNQGLQDERTTQLGHFVKAGRGNNSTSGDSTL
jgi:hypothetical protein